MVKRIRAAWRAFRRPDPVVSTVPVDPRVIIDAIRREQRRRGQPPTI